MKQIEFLKDRHPELFHRIKDDILLDLVLYAMEDYKSTESPIGVSLPSEAECLEKAYQFSLDIEPEKTISKEDKNPELYLNEGDVLPTEILFYKEHLIQLIKFCQGDKNVTKFE
jgi:hypothetical protein